MGWHLAEDFDAFLARAGDFLRSRPALHTMALPNWMPSARRTPPLQDEYPAARTEASQRRQVDPQAVAKSHAGSGHSGGADATRFTEVAQPDRSRKEGHEPNEELRVFQDLARRVPGESL
jgi:hypothetical protein